MNFTQMLYVVDADDAQVKSAPGQKLLFFHAPHCSPCLEYWPRLHSLLQSQNWALPVVIYRLDTSKHRQLHDALDVAGTPTLIYDNGQETFALVGPHADSHVVQWLSEKGLPISNAVRFVNGINPATGESMVQWLEDADASNAEPITVDISAREIQEIQAIQAASLVAKALGDDADTADEPATEQEAEPASEPVPNAPVATKRRRTRKSAK